jgi:large subunit ribosomal protein L21
MFAIVDIQGQQFKVTKNQYVYVHRLAAEEGSTVTFEKVLMINDEKDVKVGAPYVSGTKVSAKVVSHLKGDKVLVFKKKRRKGYQKMNGHRQSFTKITIESIG